VNAADQPVAIHSMLVEAGPKAQFKSVLENIVYKFRGTASS